ncbi:MAG: carboxypeptidase-like regulatory domain-containing protein [Cytophagales bacterium]|nr:carboxypeptidase-like regulatory domain-containing protein [Cytophagales bacterium]
MAIQGTNRGASTDEAGHFLIESIREGKYILKVTGIGYKPFQRQIEVTTGITTIDISIEEDVSQLEAVVVTGTMKEVTKMNSSIPVEVYSPAFFLKNPTPSILNHFH